MVNVSFTTDLTEIATQAAEAAGGIAGIYAGFKMLDLAKDYYNLYKDQREFYYTTFQRGVEQPLSVEVYQDARPAMDYAGRVSTMYNKDTGPFGGLATDVMGWRARHLATVGDKPTNQTQPNGVYYDKYTPIIQSVYAADNMRLRSDWTNYMFRFEEYYTDNRIDIWWKKRLSLHNIGVKQGTAITSAMSGALENFQSHIAEFGSQLATYANGIAKYSAYKKGTNDTADDFDVATFVGPRPRRMYTPDDSSALTEATRQWAVDRAF